MLNSKLPVFFIMLMITLYSCKNNREHNTSNTITENSDKDLIIYIPIIQIKNCEFMTILQQVASYERKQKDINQKYPELCAFITVINDVDTSIYIEFASDPDILFCLSDNYGLPEGVVSIEGYDFFYYDTNKLKVSSFVKYSEQKKTYIYKEDPIPIIKEFDTWLFSSKNNRILLKEFYLENDSIPFEITQ